jgi:hypothetical protein
MNETNGLSHSNPGYPIKIKEKHKLSLDTQKFILQMCWAGHDAQWFLKTKEKHGIDEGNEMNQRVIHSMGKIEARHIMSGLGIQKGAIKTIPELFKLMNTFMDVIIPKVMKFDFIVDSEIEGRGIVKKCFIWQMVEKSKAESQYSCACNHRHRGWLKAVGVNGKIIPLKRIPDGDEICEFKFVLQ